jgi:hypothetical protein
MLRLLLALALVACQHDAPAHPDLPPEPRTPIGYLLAAASELHLNEDQLLNLKGIDANLARQLQALDRRLRAAGKPSNSRIASGPASPSSRGRSRHRAPAGSGSGAPSRAADRLTAERGTMVRDALARALKLLDADQQQPATKLLEDRGVDLDPDHPGDDGNSSDDGISGEPNEP